jgi:integrase
MSAKSSCHLYRRGAVWWARIRIHGREYRTSLRTTIEREARIRASAWAGQIERASFSADGDHSFKEAVVRWAAEVLPGAVRPAVARRYLDSIAKLDPIMGGLNVSQITSATISAFIGHRSGVVSNATIRRDLTALSRLLSACVAWGWIAENPARTFDRSIIRERSRPLHIPTDAEVDALIAAAPEPMATILRLLDQTGMREAEAVALERRAVDWTGQHIMLVHTKTGQPRRLNWRTPGGDAGPILAGLPAQLRSPYLFPSRDGKPYSAFASAVGTVMRRVAASGVARFRVHDLRHRFAIRWLTDGGDIYRLSRHLGHTSVRTTEIYLRYLTDDQLDRIMRGTIRGTVELDRAAN